LLYFVCIELWTEPTLVFNIIKYKGVNLYMDNNQLTNIQILYQENIRGHLFMVDWRYKVMTRYFVGIGSLLIISKYLYDKPEFKMFLFIPFLCSSLFSFIFGIMDNNNHLIIEAGKRVGVKLESILSNHSGLYSEMKSSYTPRFSYTRILFYMYNISSVFFFIISILLFVKYKSWNIINLIIN